MSRPKGQTWIERRPATIVRHTRDRKKTESAVLADDATFGTSTIEDLLSAKALAPKTGAALRRRYLQRG